MSLPNTSALNERRKAEAKAKRARILSLMPSEFTSHQLEHVTGLTASDAAAQIAMMLKWQEIEIAGARKKPQTYRKVLK